MVIEVREITGTHNVIDTFRLRFEVWDAETLLHSHIREAGLITDIHDEHARHWGAFRGEELVAAARMCIHRNQAETPDGPAFSEMSLPSPVATLNRLIVHSSVRGQGLASALDESRVAAARNAGASCVVGTFPPSRVSGLQKNGFRLIGKQWIPHYAESFVFQAMILLLQEK